jgi:hypothetical protein
MDYKEFIGQHNMSNKDTIRFLEQCSMKQNPSSSYPSTEAYSPPDLSSLDIEQVIAYAGCSPHPCNPTGTDTAAGLTLASA